MRAAIEKLYGSQAGGYYDPATEELVLARDILVMVQVPVVRHQLVHALQDQTWDLKEWLEMIASTFISSYGGAHPEDPGCENLYRRSPRTTAEMIDARLWEQGGPKRRL